ncbi:hypothetical protein LJC24_02830 [Desulfococcaceae bacterium OttesenSCG-928-F15]|nr:hypothetical protein [Desulfococcaceae bacterium OttesenSCG-928-F15]
MIARNGIRYALAAVLTGVLLVIGLGCTFSLFENVPAGNICIIQSPFSGELTVHFDPGVKWQGFGNVHMYPRSGIYEFISTVDHDDETERHLYDPKYDASIKIQFNDSGAGWISGSMRYDYPTNVDKMKELHKTFQGHKSVVNGLIKPNIVRVINMTGPLMSSIESSRTRRAELPLYIEDQITNGLYLTRTKDVKIVDEVTKQESTTKVAEIIIDSATGQPKRQSESIVAEFGMRIYNLSLDKLSYESKVQKRLNDLFTADSEKQLAYTRAVKAEQDLMTAEKQGEAKAKETEWAAKAITATEVEQASRDKKKAIIEAERQRDVAILDKETAKLYKEATLLRLEADATYKERMMQADGALEQKLEAYKYAIDKLASAIQNYKGQWVPTISMDGKGAASGVGTAMDVVAIQMMRTLAKDLNLDMTIDKKK